jgi:hypothetical protein
MDMPQATNLASQSVSRSNGWTEGPWTRRDTETHAEIDAGDIDTLAMVAKAEDANLIAAAPCLYEALERITDCYGVGYRDAHKFVEAVHDFMLEGRAALSRARGEA